ncbi:hypothetical protein R5M92_04375 [Halomonas sp. Bachu 37]|uniref:hypothetical protein n=1 Tax=Halomonas kashgarensis TaxID=3084920 RepID=UPI003216B0EC
MATPKVTTLSPAFSTTQPIAAWWSQQWLQSTLPLTRMQLVWMENLAQTMQMEAQFMQALMESSEKISQCFWNHQGNTSAAEVTECYQEVVQSLTEAHMERLERVTELTQDFRRSLWEEI